MNKRGWCWINGLVLILYLDPRIIFKDMEEIGYLRKLSDIMRKDILRIVYMKPPVLDKEKHFSKYCLKFLKTYINNKREQSDDLKKLVKK